MLRTLIRAAVVALVGVAAFACRDETAADQTAEVSWVYCPANPFGSILDQVPAFAAARDGDGPWTPLTLTATGFTVTMHSPRSAIVTVAEGAALVEERVFLGTPAELAAQSPGCAAAPVASSASGTVAGLASGERVTIAYGNYEATVTGPGTKAFTINLGAPMTADLVAAFYPSGSSTSTGGPTRVIIRPTQSIAASSTIPLLDFSAGAAEPVATVPATLTIVGSAAMQCTDFSRGDFDYVSSEFAGEGTRATFLSTSKWKEQVSSSAIILGPASASAAPRLFTASARVTRDFCDINGSGEARTVSLGFRGTGNQTVTFGPMVGPVSTSAPVRGGLVFPRAQYQIQPDYNAAWSFEFFAVPDVKTRRVTFAVTKSYAGDETLTFETPDLTGLAGWKASWGIPTGLSKIGWNITVSSNPAWPVEGTVRSAIRSGGFKP